ncbi:CDGP domain-containing protein [Mycobacterium kubicae]
MSAAAALAVSTLAAPTAGALPRGCESVPWGFFGTQTRQICDGPIRPDGSWTRERIIGVPAHYVNASSSCSSGSYSSHCTYYPGGWVGDRIQSDETYPVTPDTVLPDEPGHLG